MQPTVETNGVPEVSGVIAFQRHEKIRFCKIVGTLGPSSSSIEVLTQLVEAGMNIARLNFSHGTHGDHLRNIENLRRVARQTRRTITILQDLQGPKIR